MFTIKDVCKFIVNIIISHFFFLARGSGLIMSTDLGLLRCPPSKRTVCIFSFMSNYCKYVLMEINSIKKINQSVCVPVCLSVRLSVCSQICVHDISSVSVGGSLIFLQIGSVSGVACLNELFGS